MFKLTGFLFGAAAFVYGLGRIVQERYGADVGARFLEMNPSYSALYLREWIGGSPKAALGYAVPVLFPFDLLLMVFLAAFLAVASLWLAGPNSPPDSTVLLWRSGVSGLLM